MKSHGILSTVEVGQIIVADVDHARVEEFLSYWQGLNLDSGRTEIFADHTTEVRRQPSRDVSL
jgi:hypothetical protein